MCSRGSQCSCRVYSLCFSGLRAAVSQVLHHADPTTCFGTSATRTPPIIVPISLVYGCRQDDVLMEGEMAKWCAAAAPSARLHRCVLAVSPPARAVNELELAAPFAAAHTPPPAADSSSLADRQATTRIHQPTGRRQGNFALSSIKLRNLKTRKHKRV